MSLEGESSPPRDFIIVKCVLTVKSFICDCIFTDNVLSDRGPQSQHPFSKMGSSHKRRLAHIQIASGASVGLYGRNILSVRSISQKELEW